MNQAHIASILMPTPIEVGLSYNQCMCTGTSLRGKTSTLSRALSLAQISPENTSTRLHKEFEQLRDKKLFNGRLTSF